MIAGAVEVVVIAALSLLGLRFILVRRPHPRRTRVVVSVKVPVYAPGNSMDAPDDDARL